MQKTVKIPGEKEGHYGINYFLYTNNWYAKVFSSNLTADLPLPLTILSVESLSLSSSFYLHALEDFYLQYVQNQIHFFPPSKSLFFPGTLV